MTLGRRLIKGGIGFSMGGFLCVEMNVRCLRRESVCLGGAYEMVYNVRERVTYCYFTVEVIMQRAEISPFKPPLVPTVRPKASLR